MQYLIYGEIFEMWTWEIGKKFYKFGIVYRAIPTKDKDRFLIKIKKIHIEEV